MSATPIPRTLALTIYGDLDVSSLTAFPSGKRDVKTVSDGLFEDEKSRSDRKLRLPPSIGFISSCPRSKGKTRMSETSVKKVYERYKNAIPNKVTMMHGQWTKRARTSPFCAFRSGLCPILVATSLIEVGLDVKPANLMVIYSPSHFALSSLHQLRGRIGRDGTPADLRFGPFGQGRRRGKEKLKVLLSDRRWLQDRRRRSPLRGPGEIAGSSKAASRISPTPTSSTISRSSNAPAMMRPLLMKHRRTISITGSCFSKRKKEPKASIGA
jgi:ATP-dependent DNA helicase RecG